MVKLFGTDISDVYAYGIPVKAIFCNGTAVWSVGAADSPAETLPENVVAIRDKANAWAASNFKNYICAEYDGVTALTNKVIRMYGGKSYTTYDMVGTIFLTDNYLDSSARSFYHKITFTKVKEYLFNAGIYTTNTASGAYAISLQHILSALEDAGTDITTAVEYYTAHENFTIAYTLRKNPATMDRYQFAYLQTLKGIIFPAVVQARNNVNATVASPRTLAGSSSSPQQRLEYIVIYDPDLAADSSTFETSSFNGICYIKEYWNVDDGVVLGPTTCPTATGALYTEKNWKYYPIL